MYKITTDFNYNIYIGNGILKDLGEKLQSDGIFEKQSSAKIIIASDENVWGLYGQKVMDSLKELDALVLHYTFRPGEESKSQEEYFKLLGFLAENQVNKSDILIALGGGVTGDLAGFVASTYKRGMKLVHIPTSLIAQVDSSIGGKTAINLEEGKNLVGSFYQPSLVLVDIDFLESLSQEEFSNGMAEVIKYALIKDEPDGIFNLARAYQREKEILEKLVLKSIKTKVSIITEDPFDKGARQILNLGHTVGHALESASKLDISHGRGVSIGIGTVSRYMMNRGILSKENYHQITKLFEKYSLPTETQVDVEKIYAKIVNDKKRNGDEINLVVPMDIGKCSMEKIKLEEITVILNYLQEE